MSTEKQGIITAHYIAHWGVPSNVDVYDLSGIGKVAILEFSPNQRRMTWRYATNGMSEFCQARLPSGDEVRTEVFACTRSKTEWIGSLLIGVVKYPLDYSTYLAEYDTIDV